MDIDRDPDVEVGGGDEAAPELPDLDVTDEAGQSVKGGVPKVDD